MKNLPITLFLLVITLSPCISQEKIKITKAEDLPKHSYALEDRDALKVVQNQEKILQLASMVKNDLLADLEKYDIEENASLRDYYGKLQMISMIEGDYEEALNYIRQGRKLADKESEKLIGSIEDEVLLEIVLETKSLETDIVGPKITSVLEQKLNNHNFKVIQEDVEVNKGGTEILSENLLLGVIQSRLQPAIDNNKGNIPGDLVVQIIGIFSTIKFYLPYIDDYNKSYVAYLERNTTKVEKVDIWKEREVIVKEDSKYSPVLIGIWDSGVDMPVLPTKKQWTNEKEKFDGKDTDGNGYVDDVYGIAFNLIAKKDSGYLNPDAQNLKNVKVYQDQMKGLMDLQANINSEEATKLKKHLSQLKPDDVNEFLENLNLYSGYAHGTHVAGITEEGNELARIMLARITYDYKNIPTPLTDAIIENQAKMYRQTVDYFKNHNVKVVNMSWGYSYEGVLYNLQMNGIGEEDNERKAIAKKYFDKLYDAFKSALESAPEILFVCAAGNSNDDVDFSADFPSSLNLPNLVTVGAVDIEGKKASFTTEGKSVDMYANGYEVESYVPGGDRLAFSGTSMASPNVVNLAGKILAVNPDLKPEEVIEIIVKTSTISDEDSKVKLIHPKEALKMTKDKLL